MADNPYLEHMRHQRDECESILAALERDELLSGASPQFHQGRVRFMRRQIEGLTTAITAEEVHDA